MRAVNSVKLAVVVALLFTQWQPSAWAFLWGPRTFEECLAAEMKGRQASQTGIVRASCRKRFPAIPAFMSTSRQGTIRCSNTYQGLDLEIDVRSDRLAIGDLTFVISQRTKEQVRAVISNSGQEVAIGNGSQLTVNFELGEAVLAVRGERPSVLVLECQPQ